jgi:hypothetical protein
MFIHGGIYTQNKAVTNNNIWQYTKVGNLALPTSQQPGPLLGFGQNMIDKNDIQLFVFPDWLIGQCKKNIEIAPSVLYGIRDDLSIFIEMPIAAKFKLGNQSSSGLEDILLQLEYAPYTRKKEETIDQITAVTSILLPSGSDTKTPPTGFGSPSFFIGVTASHLATDWFYYISPAVLLTTQHANCTKAGNQFLYQAGIGKNIAYSSDEWIFTWMIELAGTYIQKSRSGGFVNPDTGGNTIILGPSLWFSTQRFIAQGTIAPVISENLFGKQFKNNVYIAFNFGWKL